MICHFEFSFHVVDEGSRRKGLLFEPGIRNFIFHIHKCYYEKVTRR